MREILLLIIHDAKGESPDDILSGLIHVRTSVDAHLAELITNLEHINNLPVSEEKKEAFRQGVLTID